jgi:hypothetical protein
MSLHGRVAAVALSCLLAITIIPGARGAPEGPPHRETDNTTQPLAHGGPGESPLDPPFSANVRVNELRGLQEGEPSIAMNLEGRIYAGWIEYNGLNYIACSFRGSSDGGLTWGPIDTYKVTGSGGGDPIVVVGDSGHFYRFCLDLDGYGPGWWVLMSKSTDGGATWSQWTRFEAGDRSWPVIREGTIYLAISYPDGPAGKGTYFMKSTDDGKTWSNRTRVGQGHFPRLAMDAQGTLHLIMGDWYMQHMAYSKSLDGGATWEPEVVLLKEPGRYWPELAVHPDGQDIYVTWQYAEVCCTGPFQTEFTSSHDGGKTWAPVTSLNSKTGIESMASIAVDCSGKLHAALIDTRSGGGKVEAWYYSSLNGGRTWEAAQKISDASQFNGGSAFRGHYTQLMITPYGEVAYIWPDNREEKTDIWFSKAPLAKCGALARIEVSPERSTITADQSQRFTATGFDQNNKPVSINPTWNASAGSIDQVGLYTPGPAGTHTVSAKVGNVEGLAIITVEAGALVAIEVDPPAATITTDETQAFTALGRDAKWNPVGISPAWSASGGMIDGSGAFSPDQVGEFEVRATSGSISGTAEVTVTVGRPVSLRIEPAGASVRADESLEFIAIATDGRGNEGTVSASWLLGGGEPGAAGAIDSAGLYEPKFVGVYTVTAETGGVEGRTEVTVVPGKLARASIAPPEATMLQGDSLTFTLTGHDIEGNVISGLKTTWTAPLKLGDISSAGVFTARSAGSSSIKAEATDSEATASATAKVTVRFDFTWLLLTLLAAVAMIVAFALARRRRRRSRAEESAPRWHTGDWYPPQR